MNRLWRLEFKDDFYRRLYRKLHYFNECQDYAYSMAEWSFNGVVEVALSKGKDWPSPSIGLNGKVR